MKLHVETSIIQFQNIKSENLRNNCCFASHYW